MSPKPFLPGNWLRACLCLLACVLLPFAHAKQVNTVDFYSGNPINMGPTALVCHAKASDSWEDVLQGRCTPDQYRTGVLGFDQRAWWLKWELRNTGTSAVERWLLVGHPRLEQVDLYELLADGKATVRHSGVAVPLSQKPLPLPKPAFNIRLEAGEQRTVWLRVASQSTLDIRSEIWHPNAALLQQQRLQFFTTLAVGVMLLCWVYSLASYAMLREAITLYFSFFMLAELVVELARNGMLQLHLWPEGVPFDLRFFAAACGLTVALFGLFVRAFLPGAVRQFWAYRVFMGSVLATLAGVACSLWVDYRAGAQFWTLMMLPMAASVFVAAVLAWRRGVVSAGLLLQSFVLMLLVESIRILSLLGWADISMFDEAINPWAFAVVTSFILVSTHRRSREMQDSLAASQRESAARLEFMSQMSHELRSPLTTLLGHVRLMADMATSSEVRRTIRAMGRDASTLLGTIDEILDYARGRAGRWQFQVRAQNWGRLMRHVRANAQLLAQINGNRFVFKLEGPSDALLLIDERRLQQILNNLLTNAARYTHQGEISLHCLLEEQAVSANGWWLCFTVSDTGPGIPQQDHERVFKPFERGAHAALTEHKGIGMGLATAKQLAEAMGGTLSLDNQTQKGATFRVRLPCAAAQANDIDEECTVADPDTAIEDYADEAVPLPTAWTQARPTEPALADLRRLVENGQVTDILSWASALARNRPDLLAFSTAVKQAATELDFPRLHHLAGTPSPNPNSPS